MIVMMETAWPVQETPWEMQWVLPSVTALKITLDVIVMMIQKDLKMAAQVSLSNLSIH